MYFERRLTQRLHITVAAQRMTWVLWDFGVGTYVESIRPFKGFWLDLRVGVGPWMFVVYCGE